MFPITKNRNLPALQASGLNGFFGRFVKGCINTVMSAVKAIPGIGPIAVKIISAVVNNFAENSFDNNGEFNPKGSWFHRGVDESNLEGYEPTAAEQTIIRNWVTAKLTPFYKTMCQDLADAFVLPTANAQLAGINVAMLKMAVAYQYFKTAETTGLSREAVIARSELIAQVLAPVDTMIAEAIVNHEFLFSKATYNFSLTAAVAAQFAPLLTGSIVTTSITATKYTQTTQANPTGSGDTTLTLPVTVPGVPAKTDSTTTESGSAKTIVIVVGVCALAYFGFEYFIASADKKDKK